MFSSFLYSVYFLLPDRDLMFTSGLLMQIWLSVLVVAPVEPVNGSSSSTPSVWNLSIILCTAIHHAQC